MRTVSIKLSSIEDIRRFVDTVSSCSYDVELSSGSYTIDAKSIMGIFGLDLSKSIELTVFGDDVDVLFESIASFIV